MFAVKRRTGLGKYIRVGKIRRWIIFMGVWFDDGTWMDQDFWDDGEA